jgi:hypothetical protein
MMRDHLLTLLGELDGAWWLKAADAYHSLAQLIHEPSP